MSAPGPRLSKSKLMSGWQCPKRLWLELNGSGSIEYSAETERVFAVGNAVGEMARRQFPDGILIEHDQDMGAALAATAGHLDEPGPVTLFEATLKAGDVLIRADVLMRDENGRFRLVEVKASAGVKDYHLQDCAIQLWVLERCGLPVEAVELAHINTRFVYGGDENYRGLFAFVDVHDAVRELMPSVPGLVDSLRGTLSRPEPAIDMGSQCDTPFECPYIDYCAGPQPDLPVSWLPGGSRVAQALVDQGYSDLREIPEGHLKNAQREWVRRVTLDGRPDLRPGAAEVLGALTWPRYYFDFETIAPAIPVFRGTCPYRAQAMQWSCHIEHQDGRLEHREFLADGSVTPMRPTAEALVSALGDSGPILVYSSYERTVLKALARTCPDLRGPLAAIIDRLIDLYPVTKANYYHPEMCGSWSIKAVLPTIDPELDYEDLEIVSGGSEVEPVYLEMIAPATSAARRSELRQALLSYCERDTLAMVRLAHFLQGDQPGD